MAEPAQSVATQTGLVVRPFGDRAWLIEPPGPVSAEWPLEIAARARSAWPTALVVPGLASVLVAHSALWDGASVPHWPDSTERVVAVLTRPPATGDQSRPRPREHRIAARYDGPDLAGAAAQAALTEAELVERHCRAGWTVAAVGFSPGFAYLTSADPVFAAISRRTDPRRRVPAGAIALAAGMCAVYPAATPGGWQLVGSTDDVLWDPQAEPPALLQVGDLVRFEVR